jgi:hypothetical protein
MREVDIPGGTALLKERNDLTGDDEALIQAAFTAASSAMAKIAGRVSPTQEDGESDESFAARVRADYEALALTFEETMAMQNLRKASAFGTLHSWTLSRPLPRTFADFGKLPRDIYGALVEAAGGEAMSAAMPENFEPQGNDKENATPTGGSSSSTSPSEVQAQSPSPLTSPADTSPISGESSSPEPS